MKRKRLIDLAEHFAECVKPMHAMIELTNQCNFNCIHCYIEKNKKYYLPVDKLKESFEFLKKAGCFKVTYTGGEILEHPDFLDILKLTEKFEFIYTLFTNGYNLTEKLITQLSASIFFRSVHLSIYGVSDKTHDAITAKKGSFKRLLTTIELLKKNNISFMLKTAVIKENFFEWEEIMAFCSQNKYPHVFEFMLFPCENGDKKNMSSALEKNDLIKINKIFRDKYNRILGLKTEKNREDFLNSSVCVAGKNKIAISYNGDIYPCILLRKSAGNIFNDKIEKIWYYSEWLNELRKVKNKDISGCNICNKIEYCKYKCPGISYIYYRNIYQAPESRCLIAEVNRECSGC